MIACHRPMDHYPVSVEVHYELDCTRPQPPDRLDQAAVVRAALSRARRPLVEEVEAHMAERCEDWRDAPKLRGVDAAWADMISEIRQIALRHFPRRPAAAQPASRRAEVQALLAERMSLRRSLADAADVEAVTNELRGCARRVRQASRASAQELRRGVEEELWQAWRVRDLSRAWRLGRTLAGTSIGPGKRYFNRPITSRPAQSEWRDFLATPGAEGGLAAGPTTYEAQVNPLQNQSQVQTTPYHEHAARLDLSGVVTSLRTMKFRKSTPA